jgi:hypothetical protein
MTRITRKTDADGCIQVKVSIFGGSLATSNLPGKGDEHVEHGAEKGPPACAIFLGRQHLPSHHASHLS